jgi:hypothetical protein
VCLSVCVINRLGGRQPTQWPVNNLLNDVNNDVTKCDHTGSDDDDFCARCTNYRPTTFMTPVTHNKHAPPTRPPALPNNRLVAVDELDRRLADRWTLENLLDPPATPKAGTTQVERNTRGEPRQDDSVADHHGRRNVSTGKLAKTSVCKRPDMIGRGSVT